MLTVQILTKNNSKTVGKTIESISALNSHVVIGDLGSTDSTLNICEAHGAEIIHLGDIPRHSARNTLMGEGWNMYIEPWEILSQGHHEIQRLAGDCAYATILQNNLVVKQIRFWNRGKFKNPVFETLDLDTGYSIGAIFYSIGSQDAEESLRLIERWKKNEPLSHQPYYFQACMTLSQGNYEAFMKLAEYYLASEKKNSMSSVMLRYYYALAHLIHLKKARPVLQNINLCLSARPLMAEFWCLMGDAYYHLLKKYDDAKEFYENAIILGSRRLQTDMWPMDISKYSSYPKKMIESCEKLSKGHSFYVR